MGKMPDPSIDRRDNSGGESTPLIRPFRRRYFRDTPDGPVPYLPDGDPRHGTRNGYSNCKCSCGPCKEAKRVAQADYRARRRAVESAGAA